MKDYKAFFAPNNETWKAALDRYQDFLNADMSDYFSVKDYSYSFKENRSYQLIDKKTIAEDLISDFQVRNGINVPVALVDLLSVHGGFKIGEGILDIFGGDDDEIVFPNLKQVLTKFGYSHFVDEIPTSMLKSLNGFYYFFGVTFPESSEMSLLYFSKSGNFGKMLFAPHNQQLVLDKVLPDMFNGAADKFTLSSLLSNQIDRVITNALTVKGYLD